MEEARRGELSFHTSPHHLAALPWAQRRDPPRADLGMSRGLGSGTCLPSRCGAVQTARSPSRQPHPTPGETRPKQTLVLISCVSNRVRVDLAPHTTVCVCV